MFMTSFFGVMLSLSVLIGSQGEIMSVEEQDGWTFSKEFREFPGWAKVLVWSAAIMAVGGLFALVLQGL